jgi:hypothetical protein
MPIVVPVRLAACALTTQTTSRELTGSSVLVASERRPRPSEIVALRLYLPDSRFAAGVTGKVRPSSAGDPDGFWVDLLDTFGGVGDRLRAVTAPSAHSPQRLAARYPTSIPLSIEGEGSLFAARATDLSVSGAFVRCEKRLQLHSVVTAKLLLPGGAPVTARARIMHVSENPPPHAPWSETGVGLQFIDGDDEFRTRLNDFLAMLTTHDAPARRRSYEGEHWLATFARRMFGPGALAGT